MQGVLESYVQLTLVPPSGVPWVKREIQSDTVGEETPAHDTVIVPPDETLVGEAVRVAEVGVGVGVGVGAVERTTVLEVAKSPDCAVSVKSLK